MRWSIDRPKGQSRTMAARMTIVRMILPRIASTRKYFNLRGAKRFAFEPSGPGIIQETLPASDATVNLDDVLHCS